MTVPFEKIGPGQSGRLVYQVMGEDGPIFNPQRIRYLSPDGMPTPNLQLPNMPTAFASLAALNLAASVGAIAVSSVILRQVQQLHTKLDRALLTLGRIETKVDRLLRQVERIESRVAETNLRHSLDYIVKQAVVNDEIDLVTLARVQDDLETFSESLEDGFNPCNSFGLRLSSDVTDKLEGIYRLLFGIRYFVYTQHNVLAQGDPLRTLSINLVDDYLPKNIADPVLAVGMRKALETMGEAGPQLGEKICDDFFFAGEKEKSQYQEWLGENIIGTVTEALNEGDPGAMSLALGWEVDTSDVEEASAFYDNLRNQWLWHTSAGLLWRTYIEARGLVFGYNDAWGLGREQIEPLEEGKLVLDIPTEKHEVERIASIFSRI